MNARSRKTKRDVVGSYDRLYATGRILQGSWRATHQDGGWLRFDYSGESTVDWDSQETMRNPSGEQLFLDEDGTEVPRSEIELYVPCRDCDSDGELSDGSQCGRCGGTGEEPPTPHQASTWEPPSGRAIRLREEE